MLERFRNAPKRSRAHGGFRAHRAAELSAIRKSGETVPIELTISRIEAGGTDVVCGFVRDLTKRKRAERDLRDNEERFRQLAENIHEVFWITSADGQGIVYVSPAYEKVWGDRCEDLYENPHKWIRAIHEEDRERVNDAFFREIPHGTFDETYRIVRADGGVRWIRDRGFPVKNEDGEIYRIAGIAEDITEQKRIQQELEDKHNELLRSERLAAIGEMVTGLAHESGNALQRSQACLHMLTDCVKDRSRALELVGRVREAQDHLYRLYEQVREYAAPINLQVQLVSLDEVVSESWENLSLTREGRDASLLCDESILGAAFDVDAFACRQVFRNVLENSLSACDDPVRITVCAADVTLMGAAAIEITFRDNGPGIPEAQRARVFDPFFTTKTKGTGLGLAIARRLVEAHGGRLELGSRPIDGAEFVITLLRRSKET